MGERYHHGIVNIRAKNYIPSTILGVLKAHAVLPLQSIVNATASSIQLPLNVQSEGCLC